MKIQVINYSKEGINGDVFFSTMDSPRALDEFDIDIIDLSADGIWVNDQKSTGSVNCSNDFLSIKKMINNRKSAIILFALPQNSTFQYYKHIYGTRYVYDSIKIKDMLMDLSMSILPQIMPYRINVQLLYENTNTIVRDINYHASFYFLGNTQILTKSEKSEKTTTIQLSEKVFATTMHITKNAEEIKNYVYSMFEKEEEQIPEWMKNIKCFDDNQQELIIQKSKEKIMQEQQIILQAQAQLKENALYKSILYTTGDDLVEVIFTMLEKMLDCDMSEFKDIKREDFLIRKKTYTLIGEIKGINTNVKRENISQVDSHYQRYMDELQEKGVEENVHKVLIINPFRKKSPDEREQIHTDQIHLAALYQSLIIETKTLLYMFELFLQNKLTTEECERILTTKTGLLRTENF